MVLVLALLLTALWGVHSSAIPSMLPSKLARKSANKLDMPNLDKIRHTVLEDMKRLLDNQLADLFESADQKAGARRKLLKPKTKLHPTLNTGDTTSTLESLLPNESQNPDLIKVLTDGSLQDSGDDALRNAVDQLLQEDEDKTAANTDNGEELLYNNYEDQLNGDNSTENNSGVIFDENAFDDATLTPINTDENDSQKGKSNSRKGINHVILEHIPKSFREHDDDKRSKNILDLDEILKSALKDISSSLSNEDENSKADSEGRDLATENLYPKTNTLNDSSLQVEVKINEDHGENTFKTENNNNDRGENNVNGESETRSDSVSDHENPKIKHHTHTHKYNRNNKDHQPINANDRSEIHANNRDEIHRAGKDLIKDENDTKELKRGENAAEDIKHHNNPQHSNEKSKKIYRNHRNHHSKNLRSKHRYNKNHETHYKHHNENENHDHAANQHINVRLISDSDGSNESRLDTLRYKEPDHDKKLEINSRHQNSKETSNQRDRYDIPTLREGTVNVTQDAGEDKSNVAEFKKSDRDEEENNISEPNNNLIKEDESNSEKEDDHLEGKHVLKEKSNEIDNEKQIAREENKSLETRTGKKENNMKNEDDLGKERNEKENYVTDEIGNITTENKAREQKSDIKAKTRNADENVNNDKKVNIKEYESSKKDEIHKCHLENNERIGFESGDPNVIRDLIQNKEMKKSYSLSLTLSTK